MMNTLFFKKISLVILVVVFASCDKDFNTIGSDVIGNENFTTTPELFTVKTYNQKLPAVQTNNLGVNQLGVLENVNPILGSTKYDVVTQLSLAALKPTFNFFPVIDSVILTVPYFSTKTNTDADGKGTYTLNGMYTSNVNATIYDPVDLKVYRNGFFLRDTDPVTSSIQKHFSNESPIFNTNISSTILNNSAIVTENLAFVPSAKEFSITTVTLSPPATTVARSTPRMRLHLDNTEFQNTIINTASNPITAAAFETQSAFKNYYRGLYFKVNNVLPNKGTSMALDFTKGDVTIYYKENKDGITTAGLPAADKVMKSLTLNMLGNTINLFTNTDNPVYTTAVPTPTAVLRLPEKKLYLKGGEGSLSFIELFTPTELTNLKKDPILINEASLTFTVDNTSITNDYNKAKRIYIFNAEDNTPVFDYFFDNSTNATDASLSKFIHGGILELITGGKDKYKVRITEHINNIIKKGATNVRLGILVTENIGTILTGALISETPAPSTTDATKKMSRIPVATITNRLGTVFFGCDYISSDTNYDDRVKFEIYYTKPN